MLGENKPNQFNLATMLNYQLTMNSQLSLKIYDALGREVSTLVNEVKDAGYYSVQFDGTKLSSGIYFARLTSNGRTQIRKLQLMK
ncbi:MAG: T9SS type A sorting domain-containing protein [Bacteroidota bacterium]